MGFSEKNDDLFIFDCLRCEGGGVWFCLQAVPLHPAGAKLSRAQQGRTELRFRDFRGAGDGDHTGGRG